MKHHLCKILNVKQWQHILNKFILEKCKLPDIYDILTQCNLRWTSHLRTADYQNRTCSEGTCKTCGYHQKKTGGHKHPFRQLAIPVPELKKLKKKIIWHHSSFDIMDRKLVWYYIYIYIYIFILETGRQIHLPKKQCLINRKRHRHAANEGLDSYR